VTDICLLDHRDGILTITLNRPEVRNAANRALSEAVAAAILGFEADPALRVAIISGTGGCFCSGMELKAFARGEDPRIGERGLFGFNDAVLAKPVIAALEGPAVAGGFETVLNCDLVVAGDTAHFGLPEVRRGLAATGGGLFRLPRKIPQNIAMELALTGDMLDAPQAAQLGLVNRLVPAEQALAAARELARGIAANAPLSVEASKDVMLRQQDWTVAESIPIQDAIADRIMASADAREGALAFAEKRPPRWLGR